MKTRRSPEVKRIVTSRRRGDCGLNRNSVGRSKLIRRRNPSSYRQVPNGAQMIPCSGLPLLSLLLCVDCIVHGNYVLEFALNLPDIPMSFAFPWRNRIMVIGQAPRAYRF